MAINFNNNIHKDFNYKYIITLYEDIVSNNFFNIFKIQEITSKFIHIKMDLKLIQINIY